MTSESFVQLPWDQPGWFETATAWLHERLAERDTHATGPIEIVHQRIWSAMARVATNKGMVYFKAPAPTFRYEAGLTEALVRWCPDRIAPLLAIDRERGWIVSADAGVTLRQLGQTVAQIPHWEALLPLYSEMQIQLAERVPAMLALGVPDRRLSQLPQQYAALVEMTDQLCIGQSDGLTPEQYARLRAGHAAFAEQCAQLAAYGLPESITHEEVHEHNVLFGNERYTFIDWSDVSVGHPFMTMLVTLRGAEHWLQLDPHGPELQRMRDAYLEPWTTFAPRVTLDAALELALHLGMVNRALSWSRAISGLSPAQRADYADTVPGWLQDYLEAA